MSEASVWYETAVANKHLIKTLNNHHAEHEPAFSLAVVVHSRAARIKLVYSLNVAFHFWQQSGVNTWRFSS